MHDCVFAIDCVFVDQVYVMLLANARPSYLAVAGATAFLAQTGSHLLLSHCCAVLWIKGGSGYLTAHLTHTDSHLLLSHCLCSPLDEGTAKKGEGGEWPSIFALCSACLDLC